MALDDEEYDRYVDCCGDLNEACGGCVDLDALEGLYAIYDELPLLLRRSLDEFCDGVRKLAQRKNYQAKRERYAEAQRRTRAKHPTHQPARMKHFHAVRRGLLPKPDICELCGGPDAEGHHPDHTCAPLVVRHWCKTCHEVHEGA
jgi:hypothetical protein